MRRLQYRGDGPEKWSRRVPRASSSRRKAPAHGGSGRDAPDPLAALFSRPARLRYDELKASTRHCVWDVLVTGSAERTRAIPPLDETLMRAEGSVGPYLLGPRLGEGQFAVVRSCTRPGARKKGGQDEPAYAIKVS